MIRKQKINLFRNASHNRTDMIFGNTFCSEVNLDESCGRNVHLQPDVRSALGNNSFLGLTGHIKKRPAVRGEGGGWKILLLFFVFIENV